MFKMQISSQTENHNLRKNVATNKKNIMRKMDLKFEKPKFNISCKKNILEQAKVIE